LPDARTREQTRRCRWSKRARISSKPYAAAPSPQLPAALHAELIACAGGDGDDLLAELDVDVNAATAPALDAVCEHISRTRRKASRRLPRRDRGP
jgi:hypothetical protein